MNRRLSTSDALVLVAATAIGLAVVRTIEASAFSSIISSTSVVIWTGPNQVTTASGVLQDYWQREGGAPGVMLSYWGQRLSLWCAPCLASWTLAVLGLSCVHRRGDPWRPGGVAGAAVLLALSCAAVSRPEMLFYYRARPAGPIYLDWLPWWLSLWLSAPRLAGFAVAASWSSLALAGGWKPERGWVDVAGRLLGSAWLVLGLAGLLTTWLSVFLL